MEWLSGILVVAFFWYRSVPLWGWTLSGLMLTGLAYLSGVWAWATWPVALAFWVCWLLLLQWPWSRQRLITHWAFAIFKKIAPKVSSTEQAALDAGDTWWEAELFQGKPRWLQLMNLPAPKLTQEEEAFVNHQVHTLCRMLDDWSIVNETYDLPEAAWAYLVEERFFAMAIPKAYGGLGFSSHAQSEVVMRLATKSCTAAVTVMVPNSLGPAELLLHYGTELQKDQYIPRLARGEDIPCFALTGPEAGSDAGAIPDTGVVCHGHFEGQEVLGLCLNWNKRYITLAPKATLIGLAFKMSDPEGLMGPAQEYGITVCLLPAHLPGITIGQRHMPNGAPFMNGPTQGKDVFVPLDYIIGGPRMAGQGWRMLMECLSTGRGISLPALGVATSKVALWSTSAYAKVREQFKTPITAFEGVQEVLGRMAMRAYMSEATRLLTLTGIDQGVKPSVVTAISKYHLTELARMSVIDAMDVHGGRAIISGPHNHLASMSQAVPISITVEGANILTRNLIIFGQGAIRCHPFVQQEVQALEVADPVLARALFDKALFGHLGYCLSNMVRSFVCAWTQGRHMRLPNMGVPKRQTAALHAMSVRLAFLSDLSLMLLGGDLKRKEMISARFGDVLSHLYMASAALKHFKDGAYLHEERPLLDATLTHCLHQSQEALWGILDNFPKRWLGWFLKRWLFPTGRIHRAVSDAQTVACAQAVSTDNVARQRLCQGLVFEPVLSDPLGCLDLAFQGCLATQDARRRLRRALQEGTLSDKDGFDGFIQQALASDVISSDEHQALRAYEAARQEAIRVDDFDPQQLREGKFVCTNQKLFTS